MNLKSFNKATASAIAGAVVTIAASLVSLSPELQGSIQTVLTTILVFAARNLKD